MITAAPEKTFQKYTTKVVLIVHFYGLYADMDKIMEISKWHNMQLIEDAIGRLKTLSQGQYGSRCTRSLTLRSRFYW